MKIDLREGRGYRPAIHPHNQPLNYGTRVFGMIPSGGGFTPMCQYAVEFPIARSPQMLSVQRVRRRTGNYELVLLPDYSYAPSLALDDRLERIYYGFSTSTAPFYSQSSLGFDSTATPGVFASIQNDFRAPTRPPVPTAPQLAAGQEILGEPDTGSDTTIFVATWISDKGEESAPSQGSQRFGYNTDARIGTWEVAFAGEGRQPVEARIYMEYEGSLVLLHQLNVAMATQTNVGVGVQVYSWITDKNGDVFRMNPDRLDDPLVKTPLQTIDAVTAPQELHNIVAGVSGLVFGLSTDRRTVHISDVGNPLSFPRQLEQRHQVELLIPSYNQIVVLTDGHPSVILGSDPFNAYQIDIPFDEALVSRRGAVDMGHGIAYPSANGICFISGQRAEILTQDNRLDGGIQIIDPKDWGPYDTTNYVAGRYQGLYVWYTKNQSNIWQGHALNLKHMEIYDLPTIEAIDLHPLHIDETGDLYFYADNGANLIPHKVQGTNSRIRATWLRDIEIIDGDPYSCARITAESYNDINILVDGQRVNVTGDDIVRLPSSNRKRRVEIGAEFSDVILRMQFAHQVSEID